MSTSENKLCQGTGNISSGRYTISIITITITITTTTQPTTTQPTTTTTTTIPEDMFYSSTITEQTLGSNTYQICCPHRIVNLCSDESHPKEKKKYRHETWNIKLPMYLHIT
jgi:hypothetical protein